jgi:fructokinase
MIIVGGENLVDFIQTDSADDTPLYQAKAGGSPYNCAMAIGRQGASVGYITPISTDTLGDMLANTLTESGVDLLAQRRDEPTSLAVVSLNAGAPSYQFYRENTAERMVSLKALMNSTPDTAIAFYVGSLALADGADAEVWADYYCTLHEKGMFTALDPNIRPAFIHDTEAYSARLDRVLMQTDLLKLSDEDLNWLYPDVEITSAANMLMKRTSAKLLAVTLGSEGAFALANGHVVTVKSATVSNLRDTVGAGDTFMATLLAYLEQKYALTADALVGMDTEKIENLLNYAACAAALNCEEDGCNPPVFNALRNACE